jgi:transcriptional regulator with XRE-family HTH domain
MRLDSKKNRAPYAARMRELRQAHGKTQQQCASSLGVTQPVYAEMEANTLLFRRRDLVTLAVLYGMPLNKAFPAMVVAEEELAASPV